MRWPSSPPGSRPSRCRSPSWRASWRAESRSLPPAAGRPHSPSREEAGSNGPVGVRGSLGLIVNPVAGMGGKVGLKGTDGATLAAALEHGAEPVAAGRALRALERLKPVRDGLLLVTWAGAMGEAGAERAGVEGGGIGGGGGAPRG